MSDRIILKECETPSHMIFPSGYQVYRMERKEKATGFVDNNGNYYELVIDNNGRGRWFEDVNNEVPLEFFMPVLNLNL